MERSRADEADRPDIDDLVRQVADLTGETPEEVLRSSLRQRLGREQAKVGSGGEMPAWDQAAIDAIVAHCAALPDLDPRSADEILGYDENGLPG